MANIDKRTEKEIEKVNIEIGHWLDYLDDRAGMSLEEYTINDIRETAMHFYILAVKNTVAEIKKNFEK